MNKFSQWIITICVIIMTVFGVLSFFKIQKIEKTINSELENISIWTDITNRIVGQIYDNIKTIHELSAYLEMISNDVYDIKKSAH